MIIVCSGRCSSHHRHGKQRRSFANYSLVDTPFITGSGHVSNSTAYLDKVIKVGTLQADGHTQARIADMLASWGGAGRMSQLNQAYTLLNMNESNVTGAGGARHEVTA